MQFGVRHFALVSMLAVVATVSMGAGEGACNGASQQDGKTGDPWEDRLAILSVRTNPDYVPTVEQPAPTRYYAPGEYIEKHPEAANDPYFQNAWVAEADGGVGEFGLTFENLDPKVNVAGVFAVYIVEDLEKIVFPIPIRIADNLMMDWRDMSWVRYAQPMYWNQWPMYPGVTMTYDHSGINYMAKFIDFAPNKRWDSWALFAALPGLKVRISAFGALDDGTVVTTKPGHEVTLYLTPPKSDTSTSGSASFAATDPKIAIDGAKTAGNERKPTICSKPSIPRALCMDLERKGKLPWGCPSKTEDISADVSDFCR
jgi:hypothetical protein